MSIFRTDQQVALNDLLVESEKTADHYRDSADFLEGLEVSAKLRAIADERDRLVQRLRQAIQSIGDLPKAPDEDRESVEKLFHRMHASMSRDEIRDILQQRLDGEDHFEAVIQRARDAGWTKGIEDVVAEIQQHVDATRSQVQSLCESYPL
ncbi:hypothetical protein F6455_03290 [Proteobacteria bacterium 005FR1]|nr:hypothetical protein [Proteobacteria bacterium 005FR1]